MLVVYRPSVLIGGYFGFATSRLFLKSFASSVPQLLVLGKPNSNIIDTYT